MASGAEEKDDVYWDTVLMARVRLHTHLTTVDPDGQLTVVLLDTPEVLLPAWNGILPPPGTIIWTSWQNLEPLKVH